MPFEEKSKINKAKTRYIVIFILVGMALIGVSFCWRTEGLWNPVDVILRTINSPLSNPLDWGAIWCSIRIALWGLGLFLISDAVATWAKICRLKKTMAFFYCLLVGASLLFLFGAFMLVHSIL
jgi:hypothetical protein